MTHFAIRCVPWAPVATKEIERWLEEEIDELRRLAPDGTVRLSRLSQEGPNVHVDIGWLVELDLNEDEPLLAPARLANALRDMRLLGLDTTLLAPPGLPGLAHRDSVAAR
jgi:hypothetical protein